MDNFYKSRVTMFSKTEKMKWTSDEEELLIELVLAQEDKLFGPLKDKLSRNERMDLWRQISNSLSRRCKAEKKDIMSVKKKYFNLKQRSKQKILEKRVQMDNSEVQSQPEPESSPSDDAVFLQFMQNQNKLSVQEAVESTKTEEPSATSTYRAILPKPTQALIIPQIVPEATIGTSSSTSRLTATASHSSEDQSDEASSDLPTVKRRKLLTVKERIDLANLQNIELENERITNEILMQETMKEKLKLEMSVLRHKRDYLKLKLKSAYGVINSGSEEQLKMLWNEGIDDDQDL